MKSLVALACGIVFGAGLAFAGMTNPAKVLSFLDVAGDWDPTLALVMGSALAVSAAGVAIAGRRERSLLGDSFAIPARRDIDGPLLAGALMFGVGWGLVGLCPGPALASILRGSVEVGIFVAAMVLGVVGNRMLSARREPGRS